MVILGREGHPQKGEGARGTKPSFGEFFLFVREQKEWRGGGGVGRAEKNEGLFFSLFFPDDYAQVLGVAQGVSVFSQRQGFDQPSWQDRQLQFEVMHP